MICFLLLLLTLSSSNASTCGAVKSRYLSESCCGSPTDQAVCFAENVDVSSWSTPSLGIVDCFTKTRVSGSVPLGCESHFSPKYGTALKNGAFGPHNSEYSSFLKEPRLKRNLSSLLLPGVTVNTGNNLQNFWHSMALTKDYLLLGVRNTPSFVPSESFGYPSYSGVYKLNRTTLERIDIFTGLNGKNVMRFAPVVADGYVFSTHWDTLMSIRGTCTRLIFMTFRALSIEI